MTSSKPTKVGSFHSQEKRKMAYNNRTTLTVAPRKPLNLNCSLIEKSYIQEQMGKPIFEYDIYGCPQKLKGQLKIGDFCEN